MLYDGAYDFFEQRQYAAGPLQLTDGDTAALGRDEELSARRRAILAERDAVIQATRHGALADDAATQTLEDIDQRLRALEEDGGAPADKEGQPR